VTAARTLTDADLAALREALREVAREVVSGTDRPRRTARPRRVAGPEAVERAAQRARRYAR